MAAGRLTINAVTIRGLAEAGFADSRTFVGCYIVPTDKHRTQSNNGPEPHWNHTLYCDVPEKQSTLHVEIVNESPNRPGILGGAQVDLFPLFEQKHVEQWVPIVGAQGEFIGHLLLNLTYQSFGASEDEPPAYGAPPPSYSPHEGHSLGPEEPLPPSYYQNPPPPPPPMTKHEEAGSSSSSSAAPDAVTGGERGLFGSSHSGSSSHGEKTDWKKYGGMALAGAAALGVGAWAVHQASEHKSSPHGGYGEFASYVKKEKKKEKKKDKKHHKRRGSGSGSGSGSSSSGSDSD